MEFLKYCDFFNIKFCFYINGKSTNNSRFGGTMNILFGISCILTFFIYSLDDFKKLNPISSKSEIPNGEIKIVNINNSKIWIPWRMVTYEEKFVDHRGILHPIVSLIEGRWNSSFGMNLKYHHLNYRLCNETSMANKTNEYRIDVPLNELFCIENDDIPWGGSWYGDILYFIEINLFLCEEGINFNASDPRCTKLFDLLEEQNISWLFEFYFPVVQFQPANYDVPMTVVYRSYYYRLSRYTNKVQRIYIQENILSDDKSLFGSKSYNSSYWGVDNNLYGDTYFMSYEIDPFVKSTSSRLYSLVIYMDQGYRYYTRNYKKIFPIFSDIFPLLNFLYIIFKRITTRVKMSFAKKNATEFLFENARISEQKFNIFHSKTKINNISYLNNNKKDDNKDLNAIKKTNKNSIDFNRNKNYNDHNSFINVKKSLDNSKYFSYIDFNNKGAKRITSILHNKKEIDKKSNISNSFDLLNDNDKERKGNNTVMNINRNAFIVKYGDKNVIQDEIWKKIHKKELFSIYYFIMDIFVDKFVKPKKFCKINKNYFRVHKFMGKIFDISSHILLFKYSNILKYLFLKGTNEENEIFNLKININNESLMKEIDEINNDMKNIHLNVMSKSLFL